ncbi:MAG: MDR family oxidoreductase [Pseudomonadota bacterium]
MVQAIMVREGEQGDIAQVETLTADDFPDHPVTVEVEYSSLNYKDGLAITGAAPVLSSKPMVPGIDLAGIVTASADDRWQPGDRVLVNGFGVGERHWGGLAQRARVSGDWLVRIPDSFDTRQAMAIGTAGYTAMLCVQRIETLGATPTGGPVLVTGASGGVGSVAVAVLGKLGFEVLASTGRLAERDYLLGLGASEVLDRSTLSEPGRPIGKERWQAAVDAAGSHTLANVLAGTRYGGVVAATGLAQGPDLPGSVYPFILRNVTLAGVDSVMQPLPVRTEAWARLSRDLDPAKLEQTTTEVSLSGALELAPKLLEGAVRGRTVVAVND